MAIVDGYTDLATFKRFSRDDPAYSGDDAEFESVIESASRAIDAYCHRRFTTADTATARVYRPSGSHQAIVDDFHTTTDLAIAIDPGDTGTFSITWSSSDYELEPLNGINAGRTGWPYYRIRAVGSHQFPCSRRASLQVTAKWGWAAVPPDIELACNTLAQEHFRQRDVPFGVLGFDDFATRINMNRYVQTLLNPYRTVGAAVPSV